VCLQGTSLQIIAKLICFSLQKKEAEWTQMHGGVVGTSLSPRSERVPGSIPGWGLSVWSLHVLPVYVWVLRLPPTIKNMHVRLTGDC